MISRAKEPESSTDVMLSLQIGLFVPVVDICDCIYFWLLMEKLKLLFKKAIFLLKAFFFLFKFGSMGTPLRPPSSYSSESSGSQHRLLYTLSSSSMNRQNWKIHY